jgi:hypothetical protein
MGIECLHRIFVQRGAPEADETIGLDRGAARLAMRRPASAPRSVALCRDEGVRSRRKGPQGPNRFGAIADYGRKHGKSASLLDGLQSGIFQKGAEN